MTETPLAGGRLFGWGYDAPDGVSSDSSHVWVANFGSNAVIELSAATGELVKVLSGSSYGFNGLGGSPPTAPTCGSPTPPATP